MGSMGAGKSTVGEQIADRLGLRFVDLDVLIQSREGRTIPQLFERGEPVFRAAEARALSVVLAGEPCVLATGGGAPCQPGAMDALLQWGRVVWLRVPETVALERIGDGAGRPLADKLRALNAARASCYGRAHVRVDAGRSLALVVQDVMEAACA